jgi:hypothetical protein
VTPLSVDVFKAPAHTANRDRPSPDTETAPQLVGVKPSNESPELTENHSSALLDNKITLPLDDIDTDLKVIPGSSNLLTHVAPASCDCQTTPLSTRPISTRPTATTISPSLDVLTSPHCAAGDPLIAAHVIPESRLAQIGSLTGTESRTT